MTKLKKPVKVSPLIKLARWTCLVCGIIQGMTKLTAYRMIDKNLKALRIKESEERKVRQKILSEGSLKEFQTILVNMFFGEK